MDKQLYELTNPQKSIWLTEQFYPGTSLGNVCGTLLIYEKVKFDLLKKAINLFVKTNDSMRIKILMEESSPKQYINEYVPFDIQEFNASNAEELSMIENKLVSTSFELINKNLFKFVIIQFPDGHGGFNANLHHMICDAWSMSLLINQIMDIYKKLLVDENIEIPDNSSYVDYINFEKTYKTSGKFTVDEEYWGETFRELPEFAKIMPYETKSDSLEAARKAFSLDKQICEKINNFCKENKTSPYSFLTSIYSIYLSRVSNIDDIVIGTPLLNRSNFKDKQTNGMFVSNLPNKINVECESLFSEFVKKVSEKQMSIFRHQKYPYDFILKTVRKQHNVSRGLYDVLVSYQNARNTSQNSEIKYNTTWLFAGYITNSLDIHIYDMDNSGILNIYYDFQTSKFSEPDICAIHNRILHIINQVLNNPNICLKDIEIVYPEEKQKLLYEFNNTKLEYCKDKTIVDLFEKAVEKYSNNIAVVFGNKELTYKELNAKANALAHYLIGKGVKKDAPIGIITNRSLEMIVRYPCYTKSRAEHISH